MMRTTHHTKSRKITQKLSKLSQLEKDIQDIKTVINKFKDRDKLLIEILVAVKQDEKSDRTKLLVDSAITVLSSNN